MVVVGGRGDWQRWAFYKGPFLLPVLGAIKVVVEAGVVGKGGLAVRDHFLLPAF